MAHGDKSLELSVPYSHECGNDDICLTDLSLQLKVNRSVVLVLMYFVYFM